MNQKQVKNLFKDSEKKNIKKEELPMCIQKKLINDSYTGYQEKVRENADLLLIQDKSSEEPVILLLLEREPYEVEIIKSSGVMSSEKWNKIIYF